VERGSLLLLVGGSVFEVTTGLINVARFYPWGFFFTTTHYWVAWITLGALVMHIAAKATEIRRGLGTPLKRQDEPDHAPGSLSRRGFIVTVSAATGAVTLVTVGQTVTPLQDLAVLGQRHADIGPQHLPVNKSAVEAKVTRDPAYRLAVEGPRPFTVTLEDLQAMPQHTVPLPIACVEGWSASADWTGVRVRDLLDRAGIAHDAEVVVESMQQKGLYRKSSLHTPHTRDDRTLLALRLNGAELDLDHGFPCRLIAPDRPGVQQTKWVNRLAAL
jgi:DMSO/TMAO reductase YedYZ molybdopterin-dependent catalytic subunit